MIDKLVFLLALSREEHFGRAAEACGVTQPTLSAGIKQLETQLGVLLVERGTRFVGFTPEGLRVLDWGRRIVGDARAMREELQARRAGLTGHLRIAAVPTSLPIIARLTTPLRAQHPDIIFSVRSCTSGEVLAMLENLETDAGLTYVGNEPLGKVRHVPLYEERYSLIVASDDPLAGRAAVSWADVGAAKLCLLTPDMQNRRIISGGADFPAPHRPMGQRAARGNGRNHARRHAGPGLQIARNTDPGNRTVAGYRACLSPSRAPQPPDGRACHGSAAYG
jgi:DNA-binding transcriptional LysR family regulator